MHLDCKIIEYKDINKLSLHEEYSNIENKLIICASSISSLGMNILLNGNDQPILNIGPVINKIIYGWDSQETKFMQNIALGVVIQELISENSKRNFLTANEMNILDSVNNIREDILSSIRLMIECNIRHNDFNGIDSEEIRVFTLIWSRLEAKEDSFQNFRDRFFNKESSQYIFNNKKLIEKLFLDGLKNGLEKQIKSLNNFTSSHKENRVNTLEKEYVHVIASKRVKLYDEMLRSGKIYMPNEIILHGFYFITPIQHKILYELSNELNIKLTFLNNSDLSHKPCSFEIWEHSFEDNNINGKIIQDTNELPNSWARIVEYMYKNESEIYIKKKIKELKNNGFTIEKYSYPSIISLKNDNISTDIINSQNAYYSPYADEINSTFRNIQSKSILSNLLDTPLGQFIKILHSMWYRSREENKFYIDMNLIQNMFSTGWLTIEYKGKEINASSYTNILKDLKAYFNKCTNIKEFDNTINILKLSKKYLEEDLNLGNLICNFSFFNVSTEDIDIISTFIHALKNLIEKLNEPNEKVPQNKPIEVDKHFIALKEIIEKYKSKSSNKEIEILEIVDIIVNHRLKDAKCLPKDIFEALETYIDKKFKDENEELYNNLVLDMDGAEFTEILGFSNSCLIQIDKDFISGKESRFTWPLETNSLEFISKKLSDERRLDDVMLLNRLLLIINKKEARNKYLYYKILESNKNIKLLMINNLGKGIDNESIYNKLLIDYADVKGINNSYNNNEEFNDSDIYIYPVLEKKIFKDGIQTTPNTYINQLMEINDKYYKDKVGIGFAWSKLFKYAKSNLEDKGTFIQMNRIYNQCEKRFYYYIISDDKFMPYRDDYHHKFLFSILIHIIHQRIVINPTLQANIKSSWIEIKGIRYPNNDDDESIRSNNFNIILDKIGYFFPQWTDIEKSNLKNNALNYFKKNTSYVIELESFKTGKIPIIIPSCTITEMDLNYYNSDTYNEEKLFLTKIPKVNNDKNRNCKYCNFNDVCIERDDGKSE